MILGAMANDATLWKAWRANLAALKKPPASRVHRALPAPAGRRRSYLSGDAIARETLTLAACQAKYQSTLPPDKMGYRFQI